MPCLRRLEKGARSFRARITGDYELPDVGVGN